MPAVPLVLERLKKGITEKVSSRGEFAENFLNFAIDYKSRWSERGYDTPIVNKLVCQKVKDVLGGKLKMMFVGGAPVLLDTEKFVKNALNVKLLQGYAATGEVTR